MERDSDLFSFYSPNAIATLADEQVVAQVNEDIVHTMQFYETMEKEGTFADPATTMEGTAVEQVGALVNRRVEEGTLFKSGLDPLPTATAVSPPYVLIPRKSSSDPDLECRLVAVKLASKDGKENSGATAYFIAVVDKKQYAVGVENLGIGFIMPRQGESVVTESKAAASRLFSLNADKESTDNLIPRNARLIAQEFKLAVEALTGQKIPEADQNNPENTSTDDLNGTIRSRTHTKLQRITGMTLEQLVASDWTEQRLRDTKGIGSRSVEEIVGALASRGLYLPVEGVSKDS